MLSGEGSTIPLLYLQSKKYFVWAKRRVNPSLGEISRSAILWDGAATWPVADRPKNKKRLINLSAYQSTETTLFIPNPSAAWYLSTKLRSLSCLVN